MPTAKDIATELRRVADSLDKDPDTEIARPLLFFYPGKKEEFSAMARLLPRPLKIDRENKSHVAVEVADRTVVWTQAQIERNKVCRLVSEAVYECEPILSADDEQSIFQAINGPEAPVGL